jgi:uncharacterized protein with PQ loop repeat
MVVVKAGDTLQLMPAGQNHQSGGGARSGRTLIYYGSSGIEGSFFRATASSQSQPPRRALPMRCKGHLLVFVEILGWAAAVTLAAVALPQVIKLLRTKTIAGISPAAWQIVLGVNLAWTAHGLFTNHPNIWVPNLIFLVCSTTILTQLARHSERSVPRLFLPGLTLGSVTFALDVAAGPVVFGIAAVIPSATAQLAQLRELIIAPSIHGVSMPFLMMNVANQCLWVSWALLAHEKSVIIASLCIGSLMTANLAWATVRRLGVVRARLARRTSESRPSPAHIASGAVCEADES